MAGPSQDHKKLEQELLQQLDEAQNKYNEARQQTRKLKQAYGDFLLGHPDGAQARLRAEQVEHRALRNYHAALKTFNDFTLHGPQPPEAGDQQEAPPVTGLTPREIEILKLIAEGFTGKKIAVELGISFKTVTAHRDHIMNKLDIHHAVGLLRYAIRHKLIDPGERYGVRL